MTYDPNVAYAGGRPITLGPVTQYGTIRSLHAMEYAEGKR